jgi:nucleotide-binding universal stress UspA family protein
MPETTPETTPARAPRSQATDRVFGDILCAVDGTRRGYAAVEQAAVLAGPQGHLTLITVTAVAGEGAYRRAAIGPPRAERILEHAVGLARAAEVTCTKLIDPAGPPKHVIIERAIGHDLLALGAPVGSRIQGMFSDSVAEDALGSLTTPLLVARPLLAGDPFLRRMLVASDGLDSSDGLVDLVGRLAAAHSASVVLLHVAGAESRSRPHRIEEQARRLDSAVGGASEVRVEVGSSAEVIVEVAEDAAVSLVVAGSRGLSGLSALGSVSRRVAHEVHCSVLVIPPERPQG